MLLCEDAQVRRNVAASCNCSNHKTGDQMFRKILTYYKRSHVRILYNDLVNLCIFTGVVGAVLAVSIELEEINKEGRKEGRKECCEYN